MPSKTIKAQQAPANWAHDRAYAFVASNDTPQWVDAEWPPEEAVELATVRSESATRSDRREPHGGGRGSDV